MMATDGEVMTGSSRDSSLDESNETEGKNLPTQLSLHGEKFREVSQIGKNQNFHLY